MSPGSPGATTRHNQFDQHSDEDGSEGGAFTHRRQDTGLSSGGSIGVGGGHKEKGKIPESIDMTLINGIPFCQVFILQLN
jgi:hypothetical protein